jgi:hypothetical protein
MIGGDDMDRRYTYQFPAHLIPEGSAILVYGARDMGRDYARYIRETNYCQILAYADRDWRNIKPFYQYEIISPDLIPTQDFDYVLIATVNYHEEIRQILISMGVSEEKIKYAEIREIQPAASTVVNLYMDYFLSKAWNRKMDNAYATHPIHKWLIDSLEQYDSASLFDKAKAAEQLLDDFKACDRLAFFLDYEDERYMYGNAHILMLYSGYMNQNVLQLPRIYHSVMSFKWERGPCHAPIVIGDRYQRPFCSVPLIEIGPCIMYAATVLNHAEKTALKNRVGSVLTAFPAHSTLGQDFFRFDEAPFAEYLREEGKHYDSVFVCLNFNDISKERLRYYEKTGAKVVTAGVRSDQLFLNHLRLILDISDMVLCDHIGNPLNFATSMKKTVKWFPSNVSYAYGRAPDSIMEEFEALRDKLYKEMKSGEILSPQAIAYCSDLFGQDHLKSPEEIKAIFEINELIYIRSHGDMELFRTHTDQYLKELAGSREPMDELKYRLLANAWNAMPQNKRKGP